MTRPSKRGSLHKGRTSAIEQRNKTAPKELKKPGYKVTLENISKDGKTVGPITTYDQTPPVGYVFVPYGNPLLSDFCRETCREKKQIYYNVSDVSASTKNEGPEHISHHQRRIGFHFPQEVYNLAELLGYTQHHGTLYVDNQGIESTRLGRRLAELDANHTGQTTPTYDNEALAAAIRDIFPKMPEQEVAGVISHAFTAAGEKGKKARVGKAADLSLPRRIQLAVGAHIRHNFTEYDTFLKTLKVNNHEDRDWIRAVVEPTMVSKIREWRGEEDAELESSFREVIVIDDDDDEAGPAQDPPRDSPSSRQYTLTRPAPTQRSPPGRKIVEIDGQLHFLEPALAPSRNLSRHPEAIGRRGLAPSVFPEQRGTYPRPHQPSSKVHYPQVNSPLNSPLHSPLNSPSIRHTPGRIPRPLSEQDVVLPSVERDVEGDMRDRPHQDQRMDHNIATAPRIDNPSGHPQHHERSVVTHPRGRPLPLNPPPGFTYYPRNLQAEVLSPNRVFPAPTRDTRHYSIEQGRDHLFQPVPMHPPVYHPAQVRAGPPRSAEGRSMMISSARVTSPSAVSSQPQHRSMMEPMYGRTETIDLTSSPQHSPRVRREDRVGAYHEPRVREIQPAFAERVFYRDHHRQPYPTVAPSPGRVRLVSRQPEYNRR